LFFLPSLLEQATKGNIDFIQVNCFTVVVVAAVVVIDCNCPSFP